jgi:hypothetical protein
LTKGKDFPFISLTYVVFIEEKVMEMYKIQYKLTKLKYNTSTKVKIMRVIMNKESKRCKYR